MKIIFRTATVLFNVNILFSCHSGNFNVGKQDSIGFFCRWYPQITQSRFPFPFLPQVCLFTSEFKNKLIHVKGTKFLLKEVWVCLFCLFLFTVMFSWRTTSASILSKAYNIFYFFFTRQCYLKECFVCWMSGITNIVLAEFRRQQFGSCTCSVPLAWFLGNCLTAGM